MMTLEQAIPTATGACLSLGALAKTWPKFPNAYIPTLVAVAGAILVPSLSGITPMHVVSGFIAGLGATGMHSGTRNIVSDVRERRSGNTERIIKP
jgi:hypothetical protein